MQQISISPYSCLFYYEWKLNPESFEYNLVINQYLYGEIGVQRLDNALRRFIQEYHVFNSHVIETNSEKEWVENTQYYNLEYLDHKSYDQNLADDFMRRPFNLNTGPLYRSLLIKLGQREYQLVIVLHHMLISGMMLTKFIEIISKYYNDASFSNKRPLEQQKIRLLEFNQQNIIGEDEFVKRFWREYIDGCEPIDFKFLHKKSIDNEVASRQFKKFLFSIENKVSLPHGMSPYLYGICIYALLLHNFTNKSQFAINYPIAMDDLSTLELGCQINSNLIFFDFDKIKTLQDLFRHATSFVEVLKHDDKVRSKTPIYEIIQYDTKRILGAPFAQTDIKTIGFSFEGVDARVENNSLINLSTPIIFEQGLNKSSVDHVVRYRADILDDNMVASFIEFYKQLFVKVAEKFEDDISISAFSLGKIFKRMDSCERVLCFSAPNITSIQHRPTNLVNLLQEQGVKFPDKTAIVHETNSITYGELNEQTDRLANYLQQLGVTSENLVIVALERSIDMILAQIAIMKSGGAFVPIDMNTPFERIQHIMDEVQAPIIITTSEIADKLPATFAYIICLYEEIDIIAGYSREYIKGVGNCRSLAYIIYTSGTTGVPKGVMIEHRGMVNSCLESVINRNITEQSRVLSTAPVVFDSSILEIYPTLLQGATLFIASEDVRKCIDSIYEICLENRITTIFLTTRLAEEFMRLDLDFLLLDTLIIAGEKLNNVRKLKCRLINEYGPTENSVVSTQGQITCFNDEITIGRPINNSLCYVLDKDMQLLPNGAVGELHVGGDGIARGYYNRSDLTDKYFVKNPFVDKYQSLPEYYTQLYKTRDLVRWNSNGELVFVGRNDRQIKLRGYRIELSAIEAVLNEYDAIDDVKVIAQGEPAKNLVAYYLAQEALDHALLQDFMQAKLPEYMVPSFYVHLTRFPLTQNGKLDMRALPKYIPNIEKHEDSIPTSELESKMCQVWADVLGLDLDDVHIHSDFFKLGGDSITCIQLISKIRDTLKYNINIKDIFEYKTIAGICKNVIPKLETDNDLQIIAEQGILEGEFELLPIQTWFFDNNFNNPAHWNQAFTIDVPDLDVEKLRSSLHELLCRHDCLRLRFRAGKQEYVPNFDNLELKFFDIKDLKTSSSDTLNDVYTKWQSNFDLENGPNFCFGYVYGYSDGSAKLFFAVHHLCIDAVSWRIILDDLYKIYNGLDCAEKTSSYRQWVVAIGNYKQNHIQESEYWRQALEQNDGSTGLESLIDNAHKRSTYNEFIINNETTTDFLTTCNTVYGTNINDLLLTAVAMCLQFLTKRSVHYVQLEGHGRENIDASLDVSGTVGWFTTLYPVHIELSTRVQDSIKNIKDNIRAIPNSGLGFGALFGYRSELMPKICFNYLGQFGNNTSDWSLGLEEVGCVLSDDKIENCQLEIISFIKNGKLHFRIRSELTEDNLALLSEHLQKNIEEIKNITKFQKRQYLTESDVDYMVKQPILDALQENSEIEAIYQANSLQQGFIYHYLNQGDSDDAYRVQTIWEYKANLDIACLKNAWMHAQKRYECLRLRFSWDEQILQIIDKTCNLDFRYLDLSGESEAAFLHNFHLIREIDRHEPFDLRAPGLFRVHLIKQRNDKYTCIFSNHHAILDGWSCKVLINFVHEEYKRILTGVSSILHEDKIYSRSQAYIQKHNHDCHEFWMQYLTQTREDADLAGIMHNDSKNQVLLSEYRHLKVPKTKTLTLEDDIYENIKHVCLEHGVTLNSLLQFIWHKVISTFGNSNDTVVGMIVSGRNLPLDEIDNAVGLFVNTVPVILNHTQLVIDDLDLVTAIKSLQNKIADINERSFVNLTNLHSSDKRLFNSVFIYENYPDLKVDESTANILGIGTQEIIEKLDYPLAMQVFDAKSKIELKLMYASEIFSEDGVNSFLNLMLKILKQFIQNPLKKVVKINLLSSCDFAYIEGVQKNNNFDKDPGASLHGLFERQAKKTPDRVAVICDDTSITFKELNNKADSLASYLQNELAIERGDFVLLNLDRSINMVLGILAVLKAGAAYVPVAPNSPKSRIKYVIEDSNCKLIITDGKYFHDLQEIVLSKTAIHIIESTPLSSKLGNIISQSSSKGSDLAYMIYTSGTTGNPKGVMIEHQSIVNLLLSLSHVYDLSIEKQESCTCFTSYIFDVSVSEIFSPLIRGAKVHILPKRCIEDVDTLSDYLRDNEINYTYIPPALLKILPRVEYPHLKTIIYAGEPCDANTIEYWSNKYSLYNCYGPTETTVYATSIKAASNHATCIGKPLKNLRAYILDINNQPVPIGAIGELAISGVQVARGYHARNSLTFEKFISNELVEPENVTPDHHILYKTGDLAKWDTKGNIYLFGRKDKQIKINGYRVELEEIENKIDSYPPIEKSIVVYNENFGLITYYKAQRSLAAEEIEDFLAKNLPAYMIPKIYMRVDAFPITLSGKLDCEKLPIPHIKRSISNADKSTYTGIELKLCEIMSYILMTNDSHLDPHDNIFLMGADSISAIQFVSKVQSALGIKIELKDLYKYKSISQLSANIDFSKNHKTIVNTKSPELGLLSHSMELLPIQKWFLTRRFENHNYWNQAFAIVIPKLLDIYKLKLCVKQLLIKHDIFRLRLRTNDNLQDSTFAYIQEYDLNADLPDLQLIKVDEEKTLADQLLEDNKYLSERQSCFNLEKGPTCSISYHYGYEDGTSRLCIAAHHMLIDAVSWRIILDELHDLYHGKSLKPKGASYRQWTSRIQEYANEHKELLPYWHEVLSDCKSNNLCAISDRNVQQVTPVHIKLSADLTEKLLRESNVALNTQVNDLLLSALALTLKEFFQSEVNHVFMESHGREELGLDISHTIGWFTTLFPVRLETTSNLQKTIISIKETLRGIPQNGITFGSLVGYEIASLPEVTFNYLGQIINQKNVVDSNHWALSLDNVGSTMSCSTELVNTINFNGYVNNGHLCFIVETLLGEEVSASLAESFKKNIEMVIQVTLDIQKPILTISDIGNIISSTYLEELQSKGRIEKVYLANKIQQGLIYHHLMQDQKSIAYMLQMIGRYKQIIEPELFKQAWLHAHNKYSGLRVRFAWDEELLQIVDAELSLNFSFTDLTCKNDSHKTLKNIIENDEKDLFELDKGPLYRVHLIKLYDNEFMSLFSYHHAILDGWSFSILLDHVHKVYLSLVNNVYPDSEFDVAFDVANIYSQSTQAKDESYWNDKAADTKQRCSLDYLYRKDRDVNAVARDETVLVLNTDIIRKLNELTISDGITLNAVIQYAWHKTLNIIDGKSISSVGVTVSGRQLPIQDIEKSIGLYINTLPLIVDHTGLNSLKITEALKLVNDNVIEINSYNNISLANLQKNGERIFDSVIVFENFPQSKLTDKLNFEISDVAETMEYPLGIMCFEESDMLLIKFKYSSKLFDIDKIRKLRDIMHKVIDEIAHNPEQNVENLMFDKQDDFTVNLSAAVNTVHAYFEKIAQAYPNNIALVFNHKILTYKQLNESANKMARLLLDEFAIKHEDIVALFMEKSEKVVISMLALLKLGAAYLPIDVNTPVNRVNKILEHSGATLMLSNEKNSECLTSINPKVQIFKIDNAEIDDKQKHCSIANLKHVSSQNSLAYVIYTSGSTGEPKGVLVEHKGIINLVENQCEVFKLPYVDSNSCQLKNALWYSNYVFDAHVSEVFTALLSGNTLHILPDCFRPDLKYIVDYVQANKIHVATIPPALLDTETLIELESLVVAGEQTQQAILDYYKQNNVRVINAYGPSECTVCTSMNVYNSNSAANIGSPIRNVEYYVLDEDLQPTPLGEIGGLYIAGECLARGYLGDSKSTAERFIHFNMVVDGEIKNVRLYKTGDLVRVSASSNVLYVGRSDTQIKLRGHRIELGDIENTLTNYQDILKSHAFVDKENGDRLVAAYVSKNEIPHNQLHESLQMLLPEYMLPHEYIHFDVFPMTERGKTDNSKIFEIYLQKSNLKTNNETNIESYSSEVAQKVLSICAEVLGLEQSCINPEDNFFKLGGNSIHAVKIIGRVNKLYSTKINPLIIFKSNTIQDLIKFVEQFIAVQVSNEEWVI